MPVVYVLVGLPGSGKSTWAKKMAQESGTMIVDRDSLRTMVKGVYCFNPEYERCIRDSAYAIMNIFIDAGFDVIMDETNITIEKRRDILEMVKDRARVACVVFTEQANNLKNRMKDARGYSEGQWAEVIEKMKNNYTPVDPTQEPFDHIIYVSDPNKEE